LGKRKQLKRRSNPRDCILRLHVHASPAAQRSAEPGSAGHHATALREPHDRRRTGRRHREVLSSTAGRCLTKLTGVTQFLSGRIVNPPTSVSVAMMTMAGPGLVLLSLFFGFLGLFVVPRSSSFPPPLAS